MKTQEQVIASLPSHLQPFVATQNYANYTHRDHAIWRFLMQQLTMHLKHSAHPIYLEGLTKTGIDTQAIPKIEIMNHCLEKLGWRAAVVDGFIPPAIFIEFLAHRVLVVAVDIRSIEHMLYTPAPDIIHESAGHAPFLADVDYAEYLEKVGSLGRRVITNKSDIDIFNAMRQLSIVKESRFASNKEVKTAEEELTSIIEKYKDTPPSEATLLSRLQWWTTEYGLVGDIENYTIYGAGLLSSLSESVNCLDDNNVTKHMLTIDAVSATYDITREQPKLFVAKSCRHLSQIADEFAQHLCYSKGGAESIEVAIAAQTVNTARYNSGLEVSGVFTDVKRDAMGKAIYLKTSGPTQLAYQEKEIPEQGTHYHSEGFGSPIGKIQQMDRCLSTYSIDDLKYFGIETGRLVKLIFLSGITVLGTLSSIYRRHNKNLLFTFTDCTVTALDGECLFMPEWGNFDMAVGETIDSVYGGSADLDAFPQYSNPLSSQEKQDDDNQSESGTFEFYAKVKALRESSAGNTAEVNKLVEEYIQGTNHEWLLTYELAELTQNTQDCAQLTSALIQKLSKQHALEQGQTQILIKYALNRLKDA